VALEARRADLHAELDEVAAQRERLAAAVASGVDPAFVASGVALLDQREGDAKAALTALDVAPPPADAAAAATLAAPTAAEPAVSLTLDAGLSTAYAFRGLNTFQAAGSTEMAALFSPSVTVGLGDSGVSLGWWGGFQVTGPDAAAFVDAGLGAEQDVIVAYSHPLGEDVKVGAGLTGYLYPFAAEAVAGTAAPVYVEPSASIAWAGGVDLGLQVAYTYGVQDALSGARYVYVHPTVGKTVTLPGGLALSAGLSGGYKGYGEGGPTDNLWDLGADLAVQKDFDGGYYLRPGAHAVWTDRAGATFGESSFAWFGLNAGAVL
jgi:hypothetical protein